VHQVHPEAPINPAAAAVLVPADGITVPVRLKRRDRLDGSPRWMPDSR
jgi:hypothetical protein